MYLPSTETKWHVLIRNLTPHREERSGADGASLQHSPLPLHAGDRVLDLPREAPNAGRRLAYVFYATSDDYARAALVSIHSLKKLGVRGGVDIVLLHLNVSRWLLEKFQDADVVVRHVEPLRFVHGRYYRDVLVKLRIFQLTQYDRLIYLDADALPLRQLNYLFDRPLGPIAAPRAYWIPEPCVTTFLMVATPSMAAWSRVTQHFPTAQRRRLYDMDIINQEFRDDLFVMPDEYSCLNSEWEKLRGPFHFGDPEETYASVPVVHFTALGKPWKYTPARARHSRPFAHPIFHKLWERWWGLCEELNLTFGLPHDHADNSLRNRLTRLAWSVADRVRH